MFGNRTHCTEMAIRAIYVWILKRNEFIVKLGPGAISISRKTSHRKLSDGVLGGNSVANRLSNFKATEAFERPVSWVLNLTWLYGKTPCGISKRSLPPLLWLLHNAEAGSRQHSATWCIRHRYPDIRPSLTLEVSRTLAGFLVTLNDVLWPRWDHYTWWEAHYNIDGSF